MERSENEMLVISISVYSLVQLINMKIFIN